MTTTPAAETSALEVRANRQRNIVCVFRRGPRLTHFLGIDGPQLAVLQMENDKFEREFFHTPKRIVAGTPLEYSGMDFAMAYMKNAEARKMVPIAPSAIRVLTAIIRGQQTQKPDPESGEESATQPHPLSHELENIMASAKDDGFRKPQGPVATVHKFLDGKLEQIKKGTVSRKEMIEALTSKGISEGTAVTQAGVWARQNGVTFARPAQAAEKKSAAKAKAKKAGTKATNKPRAG